MKTKLTKKLEMVLLEGPKIHGTYKYPDALGMFGESMTGEEHETCEAFLGWLVAKGFTYGHGNLRDRWVDWQMQGRKVLPKVLSLLLSLLLVVPAAADDVGYWPEIPTPKITTFAELRKYEKARKTAITTSILTAVAAGVLITYAGQVDRKADRVIIITDERYLSPAGYYLNVQRPEQVEFQRRLRNKADIHKTIGVVMAIASVFGLSLSMSLRF